MLLTTEDAIALWAVPERKGQRRWARWLMFLGGLGVLVAAVATTPDAVCSAQTPCRPLPLTSLLAGLAVTTPLIAFVHLRLAATLAAIEAVALIWHDAFTPHQATAAWVHALAAANAVMCVVLVWWASRRPPVLDEWSVRQERSPAPAPPRLLRLGRVAVVAGLVLVSLGIACAAWSVIRQQRADRQHAAAEVVTARVTEVVDEFTIRVELPDGRQAAQDVLTAVPYSVGSTHQLAVDSQGLRQLVAEPYDATPWLALAVFLILSGLAVSLRGRAKTLASQQLFREPQPVTAVFARWHDSDLHLFAGDARNHDLPLFKLAVRDGSPVTAPAAVRATLYGIPAMDQWCTVVVNGVSFEPEKPIVISANMLPLRTGEPEQEGPPEAWEAQADLFADFEIPPERVYVSRVRPVAAYAFTLAMPLAGAELFRRLPEWVAPLWVYAIVGAVSAGMMFYGWLTLIRPRVVWNGGGVTIRGMKGSRVRTLRWSDVSEILMDHDVVLVTTDGEAIRVAAPKYSGTSAYALGLKLSIAKRHADARTAPPADLATGGFEAVVVTVLAVAVTVGLSELALWAHGWVNIS
jgi:hypothetical protein